MSIWNKILIGLIFVASIGFFYVAARTLKTHQAWKQAANSYQKPLFDAEGLAKTLREGQVTPDGQSVPGIRELKVALHDLLVDRGRVWYGANPQEVVAQTGEAVVLVQEPDPHRINSKSVLYVFEQTPDGQAQGGAYLGEFEVAGVSDKQIQLKPAMKLTDRELKRIAGTQRMFWVLYERMPGDRHGTFAGLDQAQLAALMPGVPPEVLNEYLRHGQNATADDPPDRVADGKYERQLRDYAVYFGELHRQMSAERDRIAARTIDKAFAEKTRDDTQRQVQLRQQHIDNDLKPELARVESERDTIQAHHEALDARIAALRQEVADLLAETKRLAAQWTAMQTQAAERINAAAGPSPPAAGRPVAIAR